ncbi:MAG: hypothetical protein LBR84_05825 [Tannerella sp.]|jgi:hypothetical protein|nr:hypothetical protein [Tannerella sp.]
MKKVTNGGLTVDVVAVLNEQDDYTKANWTDFHITLPDYSYYYEEN